MEVDDVSRDVRGLGAGRRAALVVSEARNARCNPANDDSPLARQSADRGIVERINELAGAYATAGGTAETHQVQITMHLPLLATISCNADVIAALEQAASVA
jgi:hypothetical protein